MGKKLFDYWTITSKAKIKAAFLIFFFTSQAPSASGAAYVLRKISNKSDFSLWGRPIKFQIFSEISPICSHVKKSNTKNFSEYVDVTTNINLF